MPPPLVKTITVEQHDVPLFREYPGRLLPVRIAEVRARVSGIVLARKFVQGSDVQKDDVLFEIDPAKFDAKAESAKAQVLRSQAALQLARQQFERNDRLRSTNVASEDQVDIARANLGQAEAELAVAKATLRDAELDLGYASVRSPIAGRIGPALVSEGALVRQEDGTQMATVRDISSVYVDFTESLAEIARAQRQVSEGVLIPATQDDVELIADDGTSYQRTGRLLFSSAVVNETTGQVTLRAEFPNPDGRLLPGSYVRVRMKEGVISQAVLVPQRAVQRDSLGQAQVLVVTDGRAATRPIVAGQVVGSNWLVKEGLRPGDQVIVDGIERAIPGTPVTAEAAKEPQAATAGDNASSSCQGACANPVKG